MGLEREIGKYRLVGVADFVRVVLYPYHGYRGHGFHLLCCNGLAGEGSLRVDPRDLAEFSSVGAFRHGGQDQPRGGRVGYRSLPQCPVRCHAGHFRPSSFSSFGPLSCLVGPPVDPSVHFTWTASVNGRFFRVRVRLIVFLPVSRARCMGSRRCRDAGPRGISQASGVSRA